jgi:NhaA family Na+:H+ antiporter
LVSIGLFGLLVQKRIRSPWLLVPLAALAWTLMHASGVHATVAGVLLAFTVPVARGTAERFEHRFRPLSAGVAVPVFAFFAAGVTVGGLSGLTDSLADSVALGIVAALVGKTVGITAATWLVSRFTRAQLDEELGWWDVVGLALLGGIGFTVSLLIGELAFGAGSGRDEHVKVGVLVGTLTAALLATVLLRLRNGRYRRIAVKEQADADRDGIPDVSSRRTVVVHERGGGP